METQLYIITAKKQKGHLSQRDRDTLRVQGGPEGYKSVCTSSVRPWTRRVSRSICDTWFCCF